MQDLLRKLWNSTAPGNGPKGLLFECFTYWGAASACVPESKAKALEQILHPEIIYEAQRKFNMTGNIKTFQPVEQRGTHHGFLADLSGSQGISYILSPQLLYSKQQMNGLILFIYLFSCYLGRDK